MSRLDPKPGRWILPLVVLGLVGFTWVFVNALPPADETAADDIVTTTAVPAGTTTTAVVPASTTTSTTPPEIAAFLLAAETVATAATDLLTEATDINDTSEEGDNFTLALNSLRDFARKTTDFADSVAATTVPTTLTDQWDPVRTAADALVTAADEMVTGLQSRDTGQIRRSALADFGVFAAELTDAVATAVAAAG